jgi:hypothetical protein
MNGKILRTCARLLIIAGVLAFALAVVRAADTMFVTGSYQVLQKTDRGSQTRVRLHLHLTNHGQRDIQIQRLTIWDFPHPTKGGSQASSVVVHALTSVDTTEEFTIPHSEYELWSRGTRPRIVLEVRTPDGRKTTQVVRLDRVQGGRAN